jgi:DNA repair protein RadC
MNTSDNSGHRARLRERFLNAGIESLGDYEILELLLSFAIPRKDTKPIAKDLIKRFKSVNGVLNASIDALSEIEGVGTQTAALLSLVKEVGAYCLKERVDKGSVVSQRKQVEEYLRMHLGHRKDEYIAALFLDTGNHVLATEIIAEGTVNQCALYPRIILEKALKYKAAAIIIAHNHPGGSVHPSEPDWQITHRLIELGRLLDLSVLDHLIVSQDTVISLRELPRWPR